MSEFMDREDIIIYKLGMIESKLDNFQAAMALHLSDDKTFHEGVEDRVRLLEATKAKQYGAMAALSVVVTSLSTWALNYFKH